jgi:hypothetical protein
MPSNLRRIAPPTTRDLIAGGTKVTRPRLIEVDPCELYVDESYQRALSDRSTRPRQTG